MCAPNQIVSNQWKKIRQKQQRLVLLCHASKCEHEEGKCPVSRHCELMKNLWKHVTHCKKRQCTVRYCMGSRSVISHFRKCKDLRCPICDLVRRNIRMHHEYKENKESPLIDDRSDNETMRCVAPTSEADFAMFSNQQYLGPTQTTFPRKILQTPPLS